MEQGFSGKIRQWHRHIMEWNEIVTTVVIISYFIHSKTDKYLPYFKFNHVQI